MRYCEIHSLMTGSILITSPAPAVEPWAVALLTLILGAAGFFVYRRRPQAGRIKTPLSS